MRIKVLFNYRSIRRVLLILLLLYSGVIRSYGYEIFYPAEKNSVTTYDYGLFIGKARNSEAVTINSSRVYSAPNGAFAYSVKLNDGENRVVIRSGYSTKVYNVYKKRQCKRFKVKLMSLTKEQLS